MKLILDNIIFSLQRTGGISVVWQQHLRRMVLDREWQQQYLEYAHNNIQRQELELPVAARLPYRLLERYRQPEWSVEEPAIFHSSYLRTLNGARNVVTIHDLAYHHYRRGMAKAIHLWQEQSALQRAQAVICVSEFTKSELLRCYPWVGEEKIHVIYNGGVLGSPVSLAADELTEWPVGHDFERGEYLLYVGNRRISYKHFPVAVETAKVTHHPLLLLGIAPTTDEKRMLDDTLGVGQWAHVEAETPRRMQYYYRNCFALLYPSTYEGFGLPLIEAQALGCPVLAQSKAAMAEILGDSALLATDSRHVVDTFVDYIHALESGRISIESLRQKGMTNAARFSWDKTYEQTCRVYRQLQG